MTQTHTEKFVGNSGAVGVLDPDSQSPDRNVNPHKNRQKWLSVLSKAKPDQVIALWDSIVAQDLMDAARVIRPPETGMVMVRGRAGGAGDGFNLGEMTVTRCAIQLASGETGIGYVAGRNKQHARIAALVDALLQTESHGPAMQDAIIAPLEAAAAARHDAISRKAKATQVEFFTMVRDRKA